MGAEFFRLTRGDPRILPQIFRLSIRAVRKWASVSEIPAQRNTDSRERPPDLPSCSRLLFVPPPGDRSSRSPDPAGRTTGTGYAVRDGLGLRDSHWTRLPPRGGMTPRSRPPSPGSWSWSGGDGPEARRATRHPGHRVAESSLPCRDKPASMQPEPRPTTPPVEEVAARPNPIRTRDKVRLTFRKADSLRWLSHHDLMRTFERMLHRSALPFRRSQGFHPHPRLVFALSLPLGVIGRAEVVELELDQRLPLDEIRDRLTRQAPAGLEILAIDRIAHEPDGPGRRLQLRPRRPRRPRRRDAPPLDAGALAAECWVERTRAQPAPPRHPPLRAPPPPRRRHRPARDGSVADAAGDGSAGRGAVADGPRRSARRRRSPGAGVGLESRDKRHRGAAQGMSQHGVSRSPPASRTAG